MAGFHHQLDVSYANIFSSSYPITAPSSSVTNPRTLFFVSHNPSSLEFVILMLFSIMNRLNMWPIHLFCRLLRVLIISLSLWTICSTLLFSILSMIFSSYASVSTFQMPEVAEYPVFVKYTFLFHTRQHSKQILSPYVSVLHITVFGYMQDGPAYNH